MSVAVPAARGPALGAAGGACGAAALLCCTNASASARGQTLSAGRDSAGGGAVCTGDGGGTIRGAAGAENKLLNEGPAIGRSDGCCNAGALWPIKFFTREINSCGCNGFRTSPSACTSTAPSATLFVSTPV